MTIKVQCAQRIFKFLIRNSGNLCLSVRGVGGGVGGAEQCLFLIQFYHHHQKACKQVRINKEVQFSVTPALYNIYHVAGTGQLSGSAKEAQSLLLCSLEPSNLSYSKYNFLYTMPHQQARQAMHTHDSHTRSKCCMLREIKRQVSGSTTGNKVPCEETRGELRAAGDYLGQKGHRKLYLSIK